MDPAPEPDNSISAPPFFAIVGESGAIFAMFGENGAQNGGPFFPKFVDMVVVRCLNTAPIAENLEKRGFRKGSVFGISLGTIFEAI